MNQIIEIVISKTDKRLSENLTQSIKDGKSYRHLYARLLAKRWDTMKGTLQNLSEEELKSTVKNMFIIERNIANIILV